jgi:hypothetical protein
MISSESSRSSGASQRGVPPRCPELSSIANFIASTLCRVARPKSARQARPACVTRMFGYDMDVSDRKIECIKIILTPFKSPCTILFS